MGNWFTDALHTVSNAMNEFDSWVNPFHVDRHYEGDELVRDEEESGVLTPGLDRVFEAVHWTYSNAFSQPMATARLQAQRDPENWFSASEWSRVWSAAEHISFAQAGPAMPGLGSFGGLRERGGEELVERVIDSPLARFEPPKAYLPAGWDELPYEEQQRLLEEGDMPVIGNQEIEKIRLRDAWFRNYTGFEDALGWIFADPTIIGLKGAGALKRAATVKKRPKGGWTPDQIDKLVSGSGMSKMHDFLWANRDNPALINNTDLAQKSAMGPRFGAIMATLKTEQELALFLRAGMGDIRALDRLGGLNATAEARIAGNSGRLDYTSLQQAKYAGKKNPAMAALYQRETERLNKAIDADTAMVSRYDDILDNTYLLDEIRATRWSADRAKARTEAQRQYTTGPARGRKAAQHARIRTAPPVGRADPVTGLPAGRDINPGIVTTRLWGLGDFFETPVHLVRMVKNATPRGHMQLDNGTFAEAATVTELRSQVARIPGLTEGKRQNIINEWLKTTSEGGRKELLDDISRLAVGKLGEKHKLPPEAAQEIFETQRQKMIGELDNMKQYSAAEGPGGLRVDAFEAEGGIKIAPPTVSRLLQSHVMPDLEMFDKVLARHGSALRALRENWKGNPDWIIASGDYLNQLWKFSTLFRLGYIPRAVGDELVGQTAALGAVNMAMRAGYGLKNGLTNLTHRDERAFAKVEGDVRQRQMAYAEGELKLLKPELTRLKGQIATEKAARERDLITAENRLTKAELRVDTLPADVAPARRTAAERFAQAKRNELRRARERAAKTVWPGKNVRTRDLELQVANLERFHALSRTAAEDAVTRQQKLIQGADAIELDGVVYPAAFGGQRGDYFMKRISSDRAMSQLFKEGQNLVRSNLERSFDHGARPISAIDDQAKHADAWAHAVNAQIAGDAMSRKFVQGASEAEVVRWLKKTGEGRAYYKRLGLKRITTPEEIAAKARHEVDEYLPLPEIRAQALTPEGVTPKFLQDAMDVRVRPTVHMANIGMANIHGMRALDRVMDGWWRFAATLPANRLSRHPLFNQLYEGHLSQITRQRAVQGRKPTVDDAEALAESSRRLAERDMKKLVFDITSRSDAAAALRWISPFFSATAESFQRWGRIMADRPEVVGYAGKAYNAPAHMGALQDQDGNTIFPDGTAMRLNPETGEMERQRVPKSERFIVSRMPKWVANSPLGVAFGMEQTSGNMVLSQNSMNVVTQGDPWFSPGVGPVVQIPVGEFVKDKPDGAELARHLGILPYGPATGDTLPGRALRQAAPATVRHFLTGFDTSDYRYQQVKMQITQRAIFEHQEHGKAMPSPEEINSRVKSYWGFSAASAFLQPMATRRKDAFQFYRDQYNNLRRADPLTADMEFIERFGEEYFIFAQSMSKNVSGAQATKRAVKLSQQYADILAEHPELGPLIIGPEGNGPFSPEAYAYQLNTPLVPGDPETQRRRMSATEAMKENQRRKGWTKFEQTMNWITNQAVQQGLSSIEESEKLVKVKRALVMMLGEPTTPDGEENPDYNEEWSKDYHSFDAKKYERLIPAMEKAAKSVLKETPERSDMRQLLKYIQGRRFFVSALEQRPFTTLGAEANSDLRRAWTGFVGTLTEQNTHFGDLHSRYLSRDLGVDTDEETELMTLLEEEEGAEV